ncbi:ABC transporter ATP-binding protein [Cohnella thailandensis]|uniref:ABC transporter ATP-binding protein n=1 Tax=Cohnella thailandensis TaxID=557557 RepID=A0A841T0N1_9BACL|nr:ABC transporter ATP-binding protein [Cohnella thailandensis]MBB6637983.1 ABC transporter ATP-binding protein [Cohnella thailandensis]MBP1976878.1 ATP-binding cassette subfamily B protein [Cohnella thailandensis]
MPPKSSLSMSWMLQYLRPVKGRMALLLLLLLATTALQLVNPLIVQRFIDRANESGALSGLLTLAGLYLAIAVLIQLFTISVVYLGNDVSWRATNRIRGGLLKHALRLDMKFHNVKTPGEMIERIDGDVTHMSNFFALFIAKIVGSFVLLAGILVYMFFYDWPIAAVMTAFTVASICVMYAIRDMGVNASQAERQASAALFGLIEERIAGIEDVQANGGVPRLMNRYHRAMRKVFLTGRRAWMLRVMPWNVTVVLFTVAVTAVLLLSVRQYLNGHITLGTLFLFFQYTQMLNEPIEQLGDQMQEFQKAKSGMRRTRELLSLRSEIKEGQEEWLPEGPLSVSFEGVSFGYNEDHRVLHDVSFELKPGERLGLVGRTGSGKSSISRLLLRLYNSDRGVIRIGGTDIRNLSLPALYRRVGMVTQDVQLFDGTLRDNLTLFNPNLTDEEILRTTEQLGLRSWIDAMPAGLDSRLSSGGSSLSAGEAQLFALTRVFLTKPSLIILDEPSSRLDAATEAALQTAVDQLLAQCTGIVIAHRLSTLDNVDKIMVLRQGRIAEFGSREALASDPTSEYGRLLITNREEELA